MNLDNPSCVIQVPCPAGSEIVIYQGRIAQLPGYVRNRFIIVLNRKESTISPLNYAEAQSNKHINKLKCPKQSAGSTIPKEVA